MIKKRTLEFARSLKFVQTLPLDWWKGDISYALDKGDDDNHTLYVRCVGRNASLVAYYWTSFNARL
ncbi:MAG: hypothetical protein DRP42_07960, partial [Tenericutes bacterium]